MNFSFKYNDKKYTLEDFKKLDNQYICELEPNIEVLAKFKTYDNYNANEWVLNFINNSNKNSKIFSDINDCDITYTLVNPQAPKNGYMPTLGFPAVTVMNGPLNGDYYWANDKMSAEEFQTNEEYIRNGKTLTFSTPYGRSSDQIMPFFDLHTEKNGIIIAIGWTGNWKATFSRKDEIATITASLKNTKFYLEPNEKVRTMSILTMAYENEDKYNKFRKLIKNHFSHNSLNANIKEGLLSLEFWGSLPSDLIIKRINELRQHNIVFDEIWLDAGWYGEGNIGPSSYEPGWNENTGNYNINPYVHPNQLTDVRDAIEASRAKMMLWIEPERAMLNTPITKQHPEWFLKSNVIQSHYMLNLGNSDALEYVYSLVDGYVEKLHLSCYRQDFNIWGPSLFFEENDKEDRIGITEIKHITGLYKLWDRLHEKHPTLLIDNCASGGRRFDIETFKRSIPFFRSDYQCNFNENPEVIQTHNSGIAKYVPLNGCSSKTAGDIYAARSSYSTSWGCCCYNAVFQQMSESDFTLLKKVVYEYRYLQHYFSCEFYNHGSEKFDDTSWAIWQYHDSTTDSGIVMAFRRSNSPFDKVNVQLKGLSEKDYKFNNVDDNSSFQSTSNIEIFLPKKRSCIILEYK